MEMFRSLLQYLKENFLHNPIMWGIAAVVIWIMGAAFLKALRGKDKDEE
jgi:ABC-type long-subunit fatty acid transport system fused permease/ATPase subunit